MIPNRPLVRRATSAVAILSFALAATVAAAQTPLPAAPADAAAAAGYPAAARRPVTHAYHGTEVADDFEWLEDGASAESRAWVKAENAYSRAWLDRLPGRDALHDRLKTLMSGRSNAYNSLVERGGRIFALKNQPPKQQPLLVTLASVDDLASEKVVFDPNAAATDGALEIDFFAPSPDGKRVAISVSAGGSEVGTLRIVDAATGTEQGDRIPRVAFPTAGGSVAWTGDGSGLFYTRYPAPGERAEADQQFYQQVWFHRIGAPLADDRYAVGQDFPRIAEAALASSRDGRLTAALVANGDGGDFSLYLHGGKGWQKVAADADGVKALRFGDDGALYLLSRQDAPRGKVLRLSRRQALAAADQGTPIAWPKVAVAVPQSDGTIGHFAAARGKVIVAELLGGPSRLRAVDPKTHAATAIALPAVTGVAELAEIGRGAVLAEVTSYLVPNAWMHVDPGKAPRRSALVESAEANFADCEIVREFATSKDGTQVPLNILFRKGTRLDGRNPTILYGYGGFGLSQTPRFRSELRVWLDRGGVYVDANLRGGSEFGEAWHAAGNLTKKQNVFDDFIAAAEYLVHQGYTRSAQLGIMGGSNGGLLMGAALTQRPQLFRAVFSSVGIYDMLRVELDPNGAFNVTEFGSVKDKAQFDALHAYSPLHRVKDGTAYPAVLMQTGDNDGRVNPAHSRKMIARLQAADPAGRPILLSTSATSGHGIGTALDERIAQSTDRYGFLINELMGPAAK